MLWGRNRSQVLWKGGSAGQGERQERVEHTYIYKQGEQFPKAIGWENERGWFS